MPFQMLRALARSELPQVFDDQEDIEKLTLLCAAGLIEASIPPGFVKGARWNYTGPAVVQRLTDRGLTAGKTQRPPQAAIYAAAA